MLKIAPALCAGNTLVLKAAEDAPLGLLRVAELCNEQLPPGVVNLLTGPGGKVGAHLVAHPQIDFIAFTGSKEVGLHINEQAARPRQGQLWIKRVVAEMGGKDAIIVDDTADLEAAAERLGRDGYERRRIDATTQAHAQTRATRCACTQHAFHAAHQRVRVQARHSPLPQLVEDVALSCRYAPGKSDSQQA